MSTKLNRVIDDRLAHIHTVVVPLARRKNVAERAMVRDLSEANITRFRAAVEAYRESMRQYHVLTDQMNSLLENEDEGDAPACRF